ncbi:protein NLRC5-like, partial [Orbicella faveolata]|uniref:protein NLRC5-like n=1 Tax=Orbicella faveolata TaxID=48498 RepID=UPI0009E2DC22
MESLKELLKPKTFNRISYVAIICWILFGVILLGIFAEMENSESRFDFRCAAKSEKIDLVRGQCFEQYEKQYNKSGVPVYAFVILNFSLIGIVGVIYSQGVKSRVDQLLAANRERDAERQNNDNPTERKRRLFVAYLCQLANRFAMGIVFIVLQTQVLYPANFPSDFLCQIAGGSHAANGSSTSNIQNSTMYECHNQRATRKTFWIHAVTFVNGALALSILIEIICILSRARKGKKFLEDSQFLADHLPPREEQDSRESVDQELQQQEDSRESEDQELQQEDSQTSEDEEPQQLPSKISTLMDSLKESIRHFTERPTDLEALFKKDHGDPTRNEDLKIDSIYTNLVLITNTAQYDFSGDRERQLNVYPRPKGNSLPKTRGDVVDVKNEKVLIVGRPGIGKTLFCTKFLREWASNQRLFNAKLHFDFALLLKFRKFNSVEQLSLRELLSAAELSPPEYLNDEVLSYILENPGKLLILFDGLDESAYISSFRDNQPVSMSEEQRMPLSALLYNIVKGHLLRGATVLTTTRPTAVSDVKHFPFRRTFEILGFASEQVEEYVNNFTKNAAENDTGKKIWQHISTNMNIFTLCYIPVNLFIVCSCLLEVLNYKTLSTGLPEKLTRIYQIATKLFFFRHNEPYRDKRLHREDIESKDWPPEFKPLSKIAFDGIRERKLVFGANEVSKDVVQSALFHRLPDLQTDSFKYEAQFCFLH